MMRCLLAFLVLLSLPAHAAPVPRIIGADTTCVTQEGDQVLGVARKFGVALDHIVWSNDVPVSGPLKPGTTLLVPRRRVPPADPPRDGLVVNVPERVMYLYRAGRLHRWYPVGVGNPGSPTPIGSYRVKERVVHPTYYPPDRSPAVPPGPDNPLGDRWIGLTVGAVGIHGTNDPWSIGDAASGGCMRAWPETIREVFELVGVGTLVRIDYDTVRIGMDDNGRILVASWPDPYYEAPPKQEAVRLARVYGLDEDAVLETMAWARPGVLTPLIGQARSIRIAGHAFPGAPVSDSEGLWIPAAAAESLGLAVSPDAQKRTVTVTKDGRSVTLPLGFRRRAAGAAWLQKDALYLPLEATLDPFAVRYRWKGEVLEIR